MKLKSLLVISVILTTMTFSGCTCKEQVRYVDVPLPYAVPVPCDVPDVNCSFKGEGSEPVIRMLECIVDQKKAIEVCDGK